MEFQLTNKLDVTGISKNYKGLEALKNIDFDVKNQEFLSVLGPSGCGKTTLLRILIGLLEPDTGKVLKDGIDITNISSDQRGMGIVFQNYALFENMTVLQNVKYALKFHNVSKIEAAEKAEQMLEIVGLKDCAGKMPKALSGGQQQRVAIARTLVLNPDIILLDEPMSALDVATRLTMRKELKKIQDSFGATIIYITHDQEEAFALSDRIMIMDHGAISQFDTPENIVNCPANEYVQTFVLDNLQAKIESLMKFTNRK